MKVSVDNETCVGCGLCESICPEVFVMEGSLAVLKIEEVPASLEAQVKQSAADCPVTAIILK